MSNPDYQRAYYRKHKARKLRYAKKWYVKYRTKRLQREYGISEDDYWCLYHEQGGVCAICRRPETLKNGRKKSVTNRLCVDHDHETGAVRGLLCYTCNLGLGYLGDDSLRLRSAVDYLEKNRG